MILLVKGFGSKGLHGFNFGCIWQNARWDPDINPSNCSNCCLSISHFWWCTYIKTPYHGIPWLHPPGIQGAGERLPHCGEEVAPLCRGGESWGPLQHAGRTNLYGVLADWGALGGLGGSWVMGELGGNWVFGLVHPWRVFSRTKGGFFWLGFVQYWGTFSRWTREQHGGTTKYFF